jgi:repressor LexA
MSPLQHRIYQFIKIFLTEHGYSPTLSVIAKGIGISPQSKSLVSRYVHKLVKSGQLVFDGKGYRNINLPPTTRLQLPIEGTISAGSPRLLCTIKEHEMLDLNSILGKEDSFFLIIEGDFLADDGILTGDKIICKRHSTVQEGAVAVVTIDKQLTILKRIHFFNDETIVLKSINPASSSTTYTAERVTIDAMVIGVLRLL